MRKDEQITIKVRKSTHEKALMAQAKIIRIRKERVSLSQVYDELISAAAKWLRVDVKSANPEPADVPPQA